MPTQGNKKLLNYVLLPLPLLTASKLRRARKTVEKMITLLAILASTESGLKVLVQNMK